ncbi:MAG TPA: DUF362 domain-containing protein [Candidatus Obscuribacterales bacterium]
MHKDPRKINRRSFIHGCMAAAALAGCSKTNSAGEHVALPTEAQKAWKNSPSVSTVAIVPCPSYEEDPLPSLKKFAAELKLPDLSGKRAIIKPNMVEYRPGKPVTTDPHALKAAVELADHLGAKEIVVAEGPGHMRDTEFLLDATGLGAMLNKLSLPFIDLNIDDIEKVENKNGFSGLEFFYLPKTIVEADAIISLPKMKTHHWVGMTASMKNFFGTVPGRKYGWPKNLLHVKGIPQCILDLVHIIKPTFALVDAVVAMEGDGPINGTAKEMGFFVLGQDLAAVDATCARTMTIDPESLTYISRAGSVIGNISLDSVRVIGSPIEKVRKEFARPITFLHKELLAQSDKQGS